MITMKNYENCFLFHLKSFFHSQDILIFVFPSSPLFWHIAKPKPTEHRMPKHQIRNSKIWNTKPRTPNPDWQNWNTNLRNYIIEQNSKTQKPNLESTSRPCGMLH